jgi:type I restriction enzyme S subunit
LEGLEISEILLSEVLKDNDSFRFDAEYFKKEYLILDILLKDKKLEIIANICKVADGDHSKFPENQKEEVRYLQAKDIKRNFLIDDNPVLVSLDYFNKNSRSHIFEENILLSIMGNVGDITITPKGFKPAIANRAVAILKEIKKINPYYFFTYLITKQANLQIERQKNGGVQERINLDVLGKIKIPTFSLSFQTQIESLVKLAHSKLEESKTLYSSAENLLLSALGLNNFENTKVETNYNIKSFKDSFLTSGRLDAEYYQPKYEELEKRIREYEGGFCKIGDYFTQNKSTFIRNKKGFNYIEIGDISVSDGSVGFNFIETENLPDNAKIKANKGDLLVSKVRPNRGAVAIIDFEQEDLVCSGAFTVLQETKNSPIKKETLQVFLRLENIKDLLLKYNCGTSYPVIKDEDILALEIPFFSQEIQTQISSQVQESFRLRAESERLLALAKEAVEVAIEEGEEEAEKLL